MCFSCQCFFDYYTDSLILIQMSVQCKWGGALDSEMITKCFVKCTDTYSNEPKSTATEKHMREYSGFVQQATLVYTCTQSGISTSCWVWGSLMGPSFLQWKIPQNEYLLCGSTVPPCGSGLPLVIPELLFKSFMTVILVTELDKIPIFSVKFSFY